ncbi:MAG: transglycosylase domain-containing protein [Micavibrio sp.]
MKILKAILAASLCAAALLALFTWAAMKPAGKDFDAVLARTYHARMTDRHGAPLSISYQEQWNTHDTLKLYALPELLVTGFLFSEDKRFYGHSGIDWRARASALRQNIKQRRAVRGASTISEQVVRILHPRPRTLWSKWVEGWEAFALERHADKATILEFYLNQLPYAAHRRGIAQASRYYFNRSPGTLSAKEMLALVILARAPSAYDLYRHPERLEKPLSRLAGGLLKSGAITHEMHRDIVLSGLSLAPPSLPVEARHFVRFAQLNSLSPIQETTLDGGLQNKVQDILDTRLKSLAARNVRNGGAIIIDHENGEIVAWVAAGARDSATPAGEIDPVLAPRQPGSTLKPFVYAAALERGWNAATFLNDAPLAEAVGSGLHRFRNYSNTHYGPIPLREALGNSLNIPAVLAINHVGVAAFLHDLHRLGFDSLTQDADFYDEGLALGNGEVSLYELTRAYAALANRGVYSVPRFSHETPRKERNIAVYTKETASLIGDILSDRRARALEFGSDSILNLPFPTAVKTGTSTDYRDAWTVGYNDRYTVGIWMGNLDRASMHEVTGSTGPALALRSIFHVLNRGRETKPLYLSPAFLEKEICTRPAGADGACPRRTEYMLESDEIMTAGRMDTHDARERRELVRPTQGLMMAYDPRIPPENQKFRFELAGLQDGEEIEWILNGETLGKHASPTYLWPVERGEHKLSVTIHRYNGVRQDLSPVSFIVR